jgi:hypothetical protein
MRYTYKHTETDELDDSQDIYNEDFSVKKKKLRGGPQENNVTRLFGCALHYRKQNRFQKQ